MGNTKAREFTSAEIAREMLRLFGDEAQEGIKVEMKYCKEVAEFVRKIEEAHRNAAKSKLVFRACA